MGKCQSSPGSEDLTLPIKQVPSSTHKSSNRKKQEKDEPSQDFATISATVPQLSKAVNQRLAELGPFNYEDCKDYQSGKQLPPYSLKNGTVYMGEWKKGKTHGVGKYYLPDGSFFEGISRQNEIHYKGRIIHPNGDYFEGQLKQGMANGQGIYVETDITYQGQFRNNLQHGKGKQYSNLYEYVGEFVDGSKSQGKMILKNKQKYEYEGSFKNNKFHGQGIMVNDIGRYEGLFEGGVKEGFGKFVWNDGSYYEGEYNKDDKHGKGILYDTKGKQVKNGLWKNNQFVSAF